MYLYLVMVMIMNFWGGYTTNWIKEETSLIFGYGEETQDISGYDTGSWL